MPDKSREEVLENILKDKPISWLHDEIIRICSWNSGAFETLAEDAIQFSGKSEILADALIVEYWEKAERIISEANQYGGLDDDDEYAGYDFLQEAQNNIDGVSKNTRRELADRAMYQYNLGNSGFDDALLEFCHSLCIDKDDWRYLIFKLNERPSDWNNEQILAILDGIGDDEAYLSMRMKNLESGMDYMSLVSFFDDRGKFKEAVKYAAEGLSHGTGWISGLVEYLIDHYSSEKDGDELAQIMEICEARESYCYEAASRIFDYHEKQGDYESAKKYFMKIVDYTGGTFFESLYDRAKNFLRNEDFVNTETELLSKIKSGNVGEYLEVCVNKGDYHEALTTMRESARPSIHWYSERNFMKTANRLEEHYPEEIIEYYGSFMDYLIDQGAGRKRQNYISAVMYLRCIKSVYINVLKDRPRWERQLQEIREKHSTLRAFLEESRVLDEK
jgi:hypothetical protein